MELPKNKIAIGVAAALGIGAVLYIAHAHASVANAQAAADPAQGDMSGSLPTLLYASGSGGASPLPVSTSTSVAPDPTAAPAPSTGDNAIFAGLTGILNSNATDLFSKLPGMLAANGLTDFIASQEQDASGKTTLTTHADYKPQNFVDTVVAPPVAAAPAPGPQLVNDYLIAGTVFTSPQAYIDWGMKLGQSFEGLTRAAALAVPRQDPIGVAKA